MAKKWQLYPLAPADFIAQFSQWSPVIAQLLYNRGLTSKAAIINFFNPDLILTTSSPFLFRYVKAAVELVVKHLKASHKIVICGDYDADGVSAAAIMASGLKILGAQVEVWIPTRFGQGYGLNKSIIDELKINNFSLIITVDNGIRAKEEIAYAKTLGLDIIVTDHHKGPLQEEDLPDCLIVDPILETENYPFKYLSGAGVAYKFISALVEMSTLNPEDKIKLQRKFLDLACVGTIGDCVSLLGENRLIVKEGLKIINHRPRLGLRELMKVANISPGDLTEWHLGWQIIPRLNVAGRLDHANAAYKLLTTDLVEEARTLAAELNYKNSERQKMTDLIVEQASQTIIKEQSEQEILIVVAPDIAHQGNSSWSEGVIGLAAGRLVEKFAKPCLVITKSEGQIKGSGRSVVDLDIVSVLENSQQWLSRYGGHKIACGFTLKDEQSLGFFIAEVKNYVKEKLAGLDLTPVLKIDAKLDIKEVADELVEQVLSFSPFGQDNPEPIFLSRATIQEIMIMGKDKTHLKLLMNGKWALAFGRAEELKDLQINEIIDVVYTVCFNVFNGRREAQLKIIDLAPVLKSV